MDIPKLLREKRKMERIVASAVYDFEVATDFAARVDTLHVRREAPAGTQEKVIMIDSDVVLPDRITIESHG